MLSTHLSTDATIGDTVTAAVIAVTASMVNLIATLFHLVFDNAASVSMLLDIDVRTLIVLGS